MHSARAACAMSVIIFEESGRADGRPGTRGSALKSQRAYGQAVGRQTNMNSRKGPRKEAANNLHSRPPCCAKHAPGAGCARPLLR